VWPGRLAAARRAEQHQKLLIIDGQVEIMHANKTTPALAEILQLYLCHAFPLLELAGLCASSHHGKREKLTRARVYCTRVQYFT